MTKDDGRRKEPAAAQPRTLRLTDWGEENVNGVIAQFYAGAVKNHLLELTNGVERRSPVPVKYEIRNTG